MMDPPLIENVMIQPNTGPMQGDHPAEKNTPINADETYPHRFNCEWTRTSYSKNGMRKTPIMCKPKMTMITPPIFASQVRKSNSSSPTAEATILNKIKTTLKPITNARPCEKVVHLFLPDDSPPDSPSSQISDIGGYERKYAWRKEGRQACQKSQSDRHIEIIHLGM